MPLLGQPGLLVTPPPTHTHTIKWKHKEQNLTGQHLMPFKDSRPQCACTPTYSPLDGFCDFVLLHIFILYYQRRGWETHNLAPNLTDHSSLDLMVT